MELLYYLNNRLKIYKIDQNISFDNNFVKRNPLVF